MKTVWRTHSATFPLTLDRAAVAKLRAYVEKTRSPMRSSNELVAVYVTATHDPMFDRGSLTPEVSAGWWLHDHGERAIEAMYRQHPIWWPKIGADVHRLLADALMLRMFGIP